MPTNLLRLDKDIYENKKNYFFYIFPPQFIFLADLWASKLTKILGSDFEPIYIVSNLNEYIFEKNNYLLLNCKKIDSNGYDNYPKTSFDITITDLNIQFSKSKRIKSIINLLLKKQKRVLIVPYTTSFLTIENKKVKIVGPNGHLATFLDNKINAYKIFRKININSPKYTIYKNINYIHADKIDYPTYISATFSSGSSQGKVIRNQNDFDLFKKKLIPININRNIVLVEYIKKIKAVESSAIVISKNNSVVLNIMDEISNDTICIGNIFPSKINQKMQDKIRKYTTRLGKYLSKLGFRGAFGCGFIIDKNNDIYLSDLNPRKQGFYIGDILFSKKNPIDLDIKIFLKKRIKIQKSKLIIPSKQSWAYYQILTNKVPFRFKRSAFFKKYTILDLYSVKKKIIILNFWSVNDQIYSRKFLYILGFGSDYSLLTRKLNLLDKDLIKRFLNSVNKRNLNLKGIIKNDYIYTFVRRIYLYTFKKIKNTFNRMLICFDPSIHIVTESLKSLFLIQKSSKLTLDIEAEISLIKRVKKRAVLFIGGGPVPYSAIIINKLFKSKVDIIDSNLISYFLGKRYIKNMENNSLTYYKSSGLKFSGYEKYDLIYFASQMTDKYSTLERILKNADKKITIVIRSSKNYNSQFILNSFYLKKIQDIYKVEINTYFSSLHDLIFISFNGNK